MSDDMLKWLIGLLVAAIAGLWKMQQSFYKKMDEERTATADKLLARHTENGLELKEEIKIMKVERKEERKEWLQALDKNTNKVEAVAEQLAAVAVILQVVPNLQCDMDKIKTDIKDINKKLNKVVAL